MTKLGRPEIGVCHTPKAGEERVSSRMGDSCLVEGHEGRAAQPGGQAQLVLVK
jgi:hypothetical protein